MILFVCVAALLVSCAASTKGGLQAETPFGPAAAVINIRDYGAVGDGLHNDTIPIRDALAAAASQPGIVQVLVPAGTYLTAAIFLPDKDNIDIHVDTGATLLGSTRWDDFPWMVNSGVTGGVWRAGFINGNGTCLKPVDAEDPSRIYAPVSPSYVKPDVLTPAGGSFICNEWVRLTNVSITGSGTIDGQGYAWWYNPAYNNHRSEMVRPIAVNGLRLYDIHMINSPSWTNRPILCNDVHARNITVIAGVDVDAKAYSGHNVDGFDPDSCQDVLLENSFIRAGDDCVAVYSTAGPTLNVLVRNITCFTPITVTHGIETRGVAFENVTVRGDWGAPPVHPGYLPRWWKTAMRVKSDRHTNITMSNISYTGITAIDVDLGVNIELSYACQNMSGSDHDYQLCRESWTKLPGVTPKVSGISYQDIQINGGWRAGWIECLPEAPCHGVTVSNMVVTPLSAQGRVRAGLSAAGATEANGWVCEDLETSSASGTTPAPTAAQCPGLVG
jgi:polygalacturonase